jgi:protein Mpv17
MSLHCPSLQITMDRRLTRLFSCLIVWLTHSQSHTLAFARQHQTLTTSSASSSWVKSPRSLSVLRTRGGADAAANESPTQRSLLVAPLLSLGKQYSLALEQAPIVTKSVTAGCIFLLSDYLAQRLEKKEAKGPYNWTRTLTTAAVGLFYFGPAAHAWYGMIFRAFPGTGLLSTMQKATMGQLFFGPSFTCIFFAASLVQTGQFSLPNWFRKIRSDLPGAWLAGLGFWPLVDLISYSAVPVQFIPLFVNLCSLVWTIYLSSVANRAARTD